MNICYFGIWISIKLRCILITVIDRFYVFFMYNDTLFFRLLQLYFILFLTITNRIKYKININYNGNINPFYKDFGRFLDSILL